MGATARPVAMTFRILAVLLLVVALSVLARAARDPAEVKELWFEALSAQELFADGREPFTAEDDGPGPSDNKVPPVFYNGAWNPDTSTNLNAYVAALLSKDVYSKHLIDPRDAPAARRNFTRFAQLFCRSMVRLGADDCEVVYGAESLVWAVVRAGRSVLLVVRGSNTPQNWIADVTSLRQINVGDFGGGSRGTNVARGFYEVFAANRRTMMDRVHAAMCKATAAAEAEAAALPSGGAGAVSQASRLWVFGHSLGGAVALMAATYLDVNEGLAVTGVYTYGCPRVGDESWAAAYPWHDVTLRLENAGDIVPTLPFGTTWRHVGSAVAIQGCKSLASVQAVAAEAKAAEANLEVATESYGVLLGGTVRQSILRRRRRQLRGSDSGSEEVVVAAAAAADEVDFPFPISFREHWVETYVQVMWSCLPETDQELVPGPADVYDKL